MGDVDTPSPARTGAEPPVAGRAPGRPAYMPGVDGLRAVAVLAVLVYHLGAGWLPGGFLGVDVFFVISGFLITSLLLGERRATGRIRLRRFWSRRAWRLLPALMLMMLVTLAVMAVAHADEVGRLRGQVVAALAYVVNWHFIYADVPYFARFGRPSVFLHLWSLSIEEQFYALWPPVLALALACAARRWLLSAVVMGGLGSAALAWSMWRPFADPSRIYYGTDTRAVALLSGVALALALAGHEARVTTRVRNAVGAASLVGLATALLTLGDLDERLYRGGFLMVAVAAAGTILAAADPASLVSRLLGGRVMVWIGLRSYGIYLWHWPVIMLTRPEVDVPLHGAPLAVVRIGLTLAVAAASYRFVETPLRRRGVAAVRDALARVEMRAGRGGRMATAAGAVAAVATVAVLVAVAPAQPVAAGGVTASTPATATAEPRTGGRIIFVGDSVMLSAAPALRTTFGARAEVDAAVGRRFAQGAEIAVARLRRAPADAVVVIHLGNNYFVTPTEVDALMRRIPADRRVLFLTVRVPLPWQDSVNRILRAIPARYANASVVDWYAASDEKGLLVDGAHTNDRGMRRYARLIAAALASTATDTTPR